jgi:hypothetical protein
VRVLAQFAAGLGELVQDGLARDLSSVKTVFCDESTLIFETDSPAPHVARLPYLNNAFYVLTSVRRAPLPTAIPGLIRKIERLDVARLAPNTDVFRIMASIDGSLVAIPRDVRSRLEVAIHARTGARVEARGGSGAEYWVIGRRDLDSLVLGLRLAVRKTGKQPKGSLAPQLCELLIRAGQPQSDDVFLDPFGGSGSVVLARSNYPAGLIIYSDVAYADLRGLLPTGLARRREMTFLSEDARDLPSIADDSIDCVVTDPPWGDYEDLGEPYETFMADVAHNLRRVLRPHKGRLIMLVGRRREDVVLSTLSATGFRRSRVHRILVNGHPASVLVTRGDAHDRSRPIPPVPADHEQ